MSFGYLPEVENFFEGQGFTTPQAQGIAAGLFAESGLNPQALNPSSGAYGIEQALGSRLTSLRGYAGSGTLQGQLNFAASEFSGSESAAANAIRGQSTASGALSAFITQFERPAAGSETTGDIARGTSALQKAFGASGSPSGYGSSVSLNNNLAGGYISSGSLGSQYASSGGIGLGSNVGGSDYLSGVTGSTLSNAGLYASAGTTAGTLTGASGLGSVGGGVAIDLTDPTNVASTAGGDVQKGLGTVGTAATSSTNSIDSYLSSAINSLEKSFGEAFLMIALVVMGIVLVAFGLGLFGKDRLPSFV
jgi:Phage tail lysozyme